MLVKSIIEASKLSEDDIHVDLEKITGSK